MATATGSSAAADEEELYHVLSVSKNATDAELKSSFRRLSQRYHPDKHRDEDAKQTATAHFTRVKEAYEILSNRKFRRVYDDFGLEAARTAATPELELVPYSDLAERFQKECSGTGSGGRGPRDGDRDPYFNVTNVVEPRIDATGLVVALEEGDYPPGQRLAAVTQVGITTNATAYVSQATTLGVQYSLAGHGSSSREDSGVGSLALSIRRQFDTHMHAEATAYLGLDDGKKPTFGVKVFRALSKLMSASWEASFDPASMEVTSAISSARTFSDRSSASVSWAHGARGGYAFTWSRGAYDEYMPENSPPKSSEGDEGGNRVLDNGRFRRAMENLDYLLRPTGLRWTARWSLSDMSFGVVLRRPIGENAPLWEAFEPSNSCRSHVKVSGFVGVMGWDVKMAAGQRFVLSDTDLGASLGFGSMGLIMRLKVRRGGHRLSLPIVLQSGFLDAKTATIAAIGASALVSAIELLIIYPWRRWQEQKDREEAKQQRSEELERSREDARAAVRLMAVQVQRSREDEEKVEIDGRPGGGLQIERAVYGVKSKVKSMRLSDELFTDRETEMEATEVTDAVQCLVEDSAVQMVCATKSTLMGFWDPSAYGDKDELVLRIWYKFGGVKHDCLFNDDESIEIPLSMHAVSDWS